MDEVIIVDYDPRWPAMFEEAARQVRGATLGARVEHIGSTSVRGLAAKPIIDLMVGVASLERPQGYIASLAELGYEYRGEQGVAGRIFFLKRDRQLVRTHHLHMTVLGSEFWEDHLLFRERLRKNREEAERYATLKRELAARFRHCREKYTAAKSQYIEAVMRPQLSAV